MDPKPLVLRHLDHNKIVFPPSPPSLPLISDSIPFSSSRYPPLPFLHTVDSFWKRATIFRSSGVKGGVEIAGVGTPARGSRDSLSLYLFLSCPFPERVHRACRSNRFKVLTSLLLRMISHFCTHADRKQK